MPDAGAAHPDTVLAAERLADLQRLQAEYVNYKRRVDRDRAVVQERVVRDVLESLLPTLDDIHAAREHGDLTGPFAAIADKLEGALGRYGLSRFGAKGEEFDPQQHEALMHAPWPADDADLPAGATATTVVTVLQPGYRAGEQVLRPARVAVADPA
ncbi:nucleotide exchange factor GrpE [Phycicoccus sp. HDW14]|nr:nucleotide exchange factor GrpE [Phycicoccus sp. HDW14]